MELKSMDLDLMDFFMPRADKIALLITTMILSTVLFVTPECIVNNEDSSLNYCYNKLGFPFGNYALYNKSDLILGNDLNNLNKGFLFGFAGNITFWYLVSCLSVYGYGIFTGKRKYGEVV